jgi:hypothetical protein
LIAEGIDQLVVELRATERDTDAAWPAVERVVAALLGFANRFPHLYTLMRSGAPPQGRLANKRRKLANAIERILRHGVKSGELRRPVSGADRRVRAELRARSAAVPAGEPRQTSDRPPHPARARSRRARHQEAETMMRSLQGLLGALLLAACATDQQADVDLWRSVVSLGDPPAWIPGTPLSLATAVRLANEQNEQIAIAGEDFVQALAERSRVTAGFLPQADLEPTQIFRERRARASRSSTPARCSTCRCTRSGRCSRASAT